MDELTILQAEVLKTLASPRRLEIIHRLAAGPRGVGHLADELIVEAERDGREVRYRLVDPDVMRACTLMRGVLERRLLRLASLSNSAPSAETMPS
jgi:DNA-binding transcriptional ArsR family regulator